MKLSISFNKPKTTQSKVPVLQPSAFAAALNDEEAESEQNIDQPSGSRPTSHNVESSKAMRKRMEAAKRVDDTVYEYDEVWDKMQEAKQRQQAAKEAEAGARKVSFVLQIPSFKR